MLCSILLLILTGNQAKGSTASHTQTAPHTLRCFGISSSWAICSSLLSWASFTLGFSCWITCFVMLTNSMNNAMAYGLHCVFWVIPVEWISRSYSGNNFPGLIVSEGESLIVWEVWQQVLISQNLQITDSTFHRKQQKPIRSEVML